MQCYDKANLKICLREHEKGRSRRRERGEREFLHTFLLCGALLSGALLLGCCREALQKGAPDVLLLSLLCCIGSLLSSLLCSMSSLCSLSLLYWLAVLSLSLCCEPLCLLEPGPSAIPGTRWSAVLSAALISSSAGSSGPRRTSYPSRPASAGGAPREPPS